MAVHFPFGAADTSSAMTATGAQAVTVNNWFAYIDGVTTEATGNRTLNLTIGDEVKVGSIIVVGNKTNGTETLTFGTGITGPVCTGVAGKTHIISFVYTGSAYVQLGADIQID